MTQADHPWAYICREENRGHSIIKPCCEIPAANHASVSWEETRVLIEQRNTAAHRLAEVEAALKEAHRLLYGRGGHSSPTIRESMAKRAEEVLCAALAGGEEGERAPADR